LIYLTASAVLAAPYLLGNLLNEPEDDLEFQFFLNAYDAHDSSFNGPSVPVGVSDYRPTVPLVLERHFRTLWTLKKGVLSPVDEPELKVDVSPIRSFPPRVVLMPTNFQQIEDYHVQAEYSNGKMVVSVAEPVSSKSFMFSSSIFWYYLVSVFLLICQYTVLYLNPFVIHNYCTNLSSNDIKIALDHSEPLN